MSVAVGSAAAVDGYNVYIAPIDESGYAVIDGLDGDYEDKEDRDDYGDDSEENVRDCKN